MTPQEASDMIGRLVVIKRYLSDQTASYDKHIANTSLNELLYACQEACAVDTITPIDVLPPDCNEAGIFKLIACPFCGGIDCWVVTPHGYKFVECQSCMSTGPKAAGTEMACEKWNERA